jgi:RNA-directed DNA polymerase
VDTDQRADQAWLLGVQRKLYQWSRANPNEPYRDLWNWVTDIRNLRCAWRRVAQNKGKRTPGIDGMTVAGIRRKLGEAVYLDKLKDELRMGRYRPSPCRRKFIPKIGKPGQFRPLGIPTSRIAWFKARSNNFWSQYSKRDSGTSRTGFVLGEDVTALLSTSV